MTFERMSLQERLTFDDPFQDSGVAVSTFRALVEKRLLNAPRVHLSEIGFQTNARLLTQVSSEVLSGGGACLMFCLAGLAAVRCRVAGRR